MYVNTRIYQGDEKCSVFLLRQQCVVADIERGKCTLVNHTLAWAVCGSDSWFGGMCIDVGKAVWRWCALESLVRGKRSVPSLKAVTCFGRNTGQRLVLKAQHYDIIKRYYRTKYATVEIHGEID